VNITEAVAAKLQGKSIDCRDCKYWIEIHVVKSCGSISDVICAKTSELKFDDTLCDHFDGGLEERSCWSCKNKGPDLMFFPNRLSTYEKERIYEHYSGSSG
jgi:hypothetical protein